MLKKNEKLENIMERLEKLEEKVEKLLKLEQHVTVMTENFIMVRDRLKEMLERRSKR